MIFIYIFSFLPIFLALHSKAPYFQKLDRPFVVAHRGASGYLPESTLESFALSLFQNADFTEMDVVLTKDGHLLVMHDPFLSRVTNIDSFPEFSSRKKERLVDDKIVNDFFTDDFTLEEIKKLSIKQGLGNGRPTIFDYKFKSPSLDEFLQFMIKSNQERKSKNKKIIGVFLEAKNGDMYKRLYGEEFEIGEVLIKKLKEYGLDNFENATKFCPIVLQSFPKETTLYFNKIGNNLPRIQLINEFYNYSLEETKYFAHGVGVNFNMIIKSKNPLRKTNYIENAHLLGLQVYPYTYRDDDLAYGNDNIELYRLAKDYFNVDGVFTEFCDIALTVFKTQQELNH